MMAGSAGLLLNIHRTVIEIHHQLVDRDVPEISNSQERDKQTDPKNITPETLNICVLY